MDAALDGTSVGAVSAGASSFSFFAAARAVDVRPDLDAGPFERAAAYQPAHAEQGLLLEALHVNHG